MVEIKGQPKILTNREFEVLKFLAKGYSTNEISTLLNIAPTTIITYRNRLRKKFNARNCTELVFKTTKLNII